jgi:aconitate hydratase
MTFDLDTIRRVYASFKDKTRRGRDIAGRPLTLSEKILYAHLDRWPERAPERGKTYVSLRPDRVAMQDATAQMALLQFMQAGRTASAVPATVHCDHLVRAECGAEPDLETALRDNREVYAFLESAAKKFGLGFWGPGSGIIHQILFENYVFPGGLTIGTDSHTPTAGGLGMLGVGVGGADAVDAMAGVPWELMWPNVIGIRLRGRLSGWTASKDIILKLAGLLTVKGATGCILEYFGEGVSTLSATARSTITNMGAEVGATTSVFPFDEKTARYLETTNRSEVAMEAQRLGALLRADPEIVREPGRFYDRVIDIDLDTLEPRLNGPFSPDREHALSGFAETVRREGFPAALSAGLIGSCTNSSYEDLSRVASILKDARTKKLRVRAPLFVSPGSEQIRTTLERDGILDVLREHGAVILANACGPCIGQWNRRDGTENASNSILTSFNRNFKKRNDGNPETLAFVASPELIAGMCLAGRIDFDPRNDTLENEEGETVSLAPPAGSELPEKGFPSALGVFTPPESPAPDTRIVIEPGSSRLETLQPFAPWNGEDTFENCLLLVKIRGKCTTDHISPAGKWLRFRGHLDRISENLYSGAVNAFTGETGTGRNRVTGTTGEPLSRVARDYRDRSLSWIVVGDENYGEGSSREHAAMEPRHLGCVAVIARSFARIAENNLKKQGLIVATFKNPDDYERVRETDRLTLSGLASLSPGSRLTLALLHENGERETLELNHSFSENQVSWFRAGSSLNEIRNRSCPEN